MSDKTLDDIIEPLKIAIALEREGKKMFLQAAAETKSKLAKQTFEYLANEEDRHIENIENFYHKIEATKGKEIPEVAESTAHERLEEFNGFLEKIKDEYKATETDLEAYQMALKFESGAEDFYEKKYNETEDTRVRKIYQWLIMEESMHTRLINSCIKFIDDPAGWFEARKKN